MNRSYACKRRKNRDNTSWRSHQPLQEPARPTEHALVHLGLVPMSATDTLRERLIRLRAEVKRSLAGGHNGAFQTDDVRELLEAYERLVPMPWYQTAADGQKSL